MPRINKGDVVKHFKGGYYLIISMYALDSEDTSKQYVVYQSLENKQIWIRNYDMFMSKVNKKKYPNVKQKYRFEVFKVAGD